MSYLRLSLGAAAAAGALYFACCTTIGAGKTEPVLTGPGTERLDDSGKTPAPTTDPAPDPEPAPPTPRAPAAAPAPLAPAVEKALDWLAGAQQQDGGFGAGSHSKQNVRDAHAVPTDPATTATAALALIRAGNGLDRGDYADTLSRATDYLLQTVESAPQQGPQITKLTGTQPQAKMGQNVDTALTAQYFARLLDDLDEDAELRPRVTAALDKCLRKIEDSQAADGAWTAGGWAPVLQSAQMCTALELAQLAGRQVDAEKLAQARAYQRSQARPASAPAAAGDPTTTESAFDSSAMRMFSMSGSAAAGIPLYSSASNMRNVAAQAKAAEEIVEEAVQEGKLPAGAKVEADALVGAGIAAPQAAVLAESFAMNAAAKVRAFDENVLVGFGNNGGEEFLSYQMKSESLVIDGGEEWQRWSEKMHERLAKVQNPDGSWSGHHCITSPTFCTATAISCLTAERDVDWLCKATALAAK